MEAATGQRVEQGRTTMRSLAAPLRLIVMNEVSLKEGQLISTQMVSKFFGPDTTVYLYPWVGTLGNILNPHPQELYVCTE